MESPLKKRIIIKRGSRAITFTPDGLEDEFEFLEDFEVEISLDEFYNLDVERIIR